MKDNTVPEVKELLKIIKLLKSEVEYLKEENDIYMKQIELLVRKNNNIRKKNSERESHDLNLNNKYLKNLLPEYLLDWNNDGSEEIKARSLPIKDRSEEPDENLNDINENLQQRKEKLIQGEEHLKERNRNLILPNENNDENYNRNTPLKDISLNQYANLNEINENLNDPNDNLKEQYGDDIPSESNVNGKNDLIKEVNDNVHDNNDNENGKRSNVKGAGEHEQRSKGIINRIKDNIKMVKGSINVNKDIVKYEIDNKDSVNDNINIENDNINIENDNIRLLNDNKKTLENAVAAQKSRETGNASDFKIPEVNKEVRELRMRLDENLTASLRKKFPKIMISRWVNELIFFATHERVKVPEIMNEMGIKISTLMRDTTLFKNKGWIKYYGTKKNGFYKITEEGLMFVRKSMAVSS